MDAGTLAHMIVDTFSKKKAKEQFEASPTVAMNVGEPANDQNMAWNIIGWIVSIVIGIFAFYLSWQCNTALGYHVVVKVIFAVFAFLFGLIYLILYLILRMMYQIRKRKGQWSEKVVA